MKNEIKTALSTILSKKIGKEIKVGEILSVGGGSINETARVKTNQGPFFAKWNDCRKFPKMLEIEAKGLDLLRNANEIAIPRVIAQDVIGGIQYLVLEYIDGPAPTSKFWNDFGRSLARLHRHSSLKFGLDHQNYIGSLTQSNRQHSTWNEFFIQERLKPQIKMAFDSKSIGDSIITGFDRLFSRLENIFPVEKPALLHGDLWSGNYLTEGKGEPCLIDPAVYFGHREIDMAMTRLFGGFAFEFYEAYNTEFPLQKGWQERVDICNLYPLMVHVNLFGGGYSMQVADILKRF